MLFYEKYIVLALSMAECKTLFHYYTYLKVLAPWQLRSLCVNCVLERFIEMSQDRQGMMGDFRPRYLSFIWMNTVRIELNHNSRSHTLNGGVKQLPIIPAVIDLLTNGPLNGCMPLASSCEPLWLVYHVDWPQVACEMGKSLLWV